MKCTRSTEIPCTWTWTRKCVVTCMAIWSVGPHFWAASHLAFVPYCAFESRNIRAVWWTYLVAYQLEYILVRWVLVNFGKRKFGAHFPYVFKWPIVVNSSVDGDREWDRILEVPHNSFSLQPWCTEYMAVFTTFAGKLWGNILKKGQSSFPPHLINCHSWLSEALVMVQTARRWTLFTEARFWPPVLVQFVVHIVSLG